MDIEATLREFSIIATKQIEFFKVKCPFHDDSNPSGGVHHKTGYFTCFGCGKKATFYTYLAKQTGLSFAQLKLKLGVRSDCKHPISPAEVELCHIDIWKHDQFLYELHRRCITDELIRQYRLGVKDLGHEKRITIPVINDVGEYVSFRLYIPGASTRKFLNWPARRDNYRVRLYPIEQLEYDQVLICGGELKALAAASVLNQYGIGAVSPTCGENTAWSNELNWRFDGKLVYVCSDVDEAGKKSLEFRCKILKPFARELHAVQLPLDIPKGDINDFLRLGGNLYELLVKSSEWAYTPGGVTDEDAPEEITFPAAFEPKNVNKRVKFKGIVCGVNGNSYLVPSVVEVRCTRDQDYCLLCDVNMQAFSTNTDMKISSEHPALLSLVNEPDYRHPLIYKECFHIPKQCVFCTFQRKEEYSVSEVRLEEQLEATSRTEPLTMKIGYIVNGPQTMDNQSYNLIGRLHPSPKNQLASFLASQCEPTLSSLDAYNPVRSEQLKLFSPKEWTLPALQEKLNDIYSDFEANVTKIYRRRDYHIAIDLVYHSVLSFNFSGNSQTNAYVELLAIGDTAQGKSRAVEALRTHYGLGHKVDCGNLSKAGLTAGIDKVGGKNFVLYGALPKNDKGLVILEELKKISNKDFQTLTEVRSSGLVQITKIEQKYRKARVRLIALSNPEGERTIASYVFGIDAAIALIGTNEDLRRFDLVIILGEADLPDGLPELRNPPIYSHKYTDELCQQLVLKAWKCEEIIFEDTDLILALSKELVVEFGEGAPVLDPNSSHIKVAKLSAALAARTNSYISGKEYNEALLVHSCHVRYIIEYLRRVYSSPSCKLDEKSKAIRNSQMLRNVDGLIEYLKNLNNAKEIVMKLIELDTVSAPFIRDLVGDFFTGSTLFSKLIQTNALLKIKSDRYVKNPKFTELLRSTDFESQKPSYIEEKF